MDYKYFVLLNGRTEKDKESSLYMVPEGKVLVITDITAQNRNPGDAPVADNAFSRLEMGQFSGYLCHKSQTPPQSTSFDLCYSIVGNQTLNLHFQTGMVVEHGFRLINACNSSAAFIEFTICGYLDTKNQIKPARAARK
ncbi:MAG: hypothetical protein AB9891_04215 [Anaerolineaceae bacterium]